MKNKDKTKRIVDIISNITISIMVIICGIMFAVSCYMIYKSSDKQMFTYESIGIAFSKIRIFVYITIAAIIAGAVLSVFICKDEKRLHLPKRVRKIYTGLACRVDINLLSELDRTLIQRERKLRKILLYILWSLLLIEAFLPFIFLLNPNTFPAQNGEYNDEVIQGLFLYLCILLPLIIYTIFYVVFTQKSYARETELLRNYIKSERKIPSFNTYASGFSKIKRFVCENKKPIKFGLRIAFIGCGVLFIALGIANGGMGDVLVKAVNICAECIGLG